MGGNQLRGVDPFVLNDAGQVSAAKGLAVPHLDLYDALLSQSECKAGLRDNGSTDKLDPSVDEQGPRSSWDGWTAWRNYIVTTLQASEVMCVVLDEHTHECDPASLRQLSPHCPDRGSEGRPIISAQRAHTVGAGDGGSVRHPDEPSSPG